MFAVKLYWGKNKKIDKSNYRNIIVSHEAIKVLFPCYPMSLEYAQQIHALMAMGLNLSAGNLPLTENAKEKLDVCHAGHQKVSRCCTGGESWRKYVRKKCYIGSPTAAQCSFVHDFQSLRGWYCYPRMCHKPSAFLIKSKSLVLIHEVQLK